MELPLVAKKDAHAFGRRVCFHFPLITTIRSGRSAQLCPDPHSHAEGWEEGEERKRNTGWTTSEPPRSPFVRWRTTATDTALAHSLARSLPGRSVGHWGSSVTLTRFAAFLEMLHAGPYPLAYTAVALSRWRSSVPRFARLQTSPERGCIAAIAGCKLRPNG